MNLLFKGRFGPASDVQEFCIPVDSITDVCGDKSITIHFVRSVHIDGYSINANISMADFIAFRDAARVYGQPGSTFSYEKWRSDVEFRKKCGC